MSQFLSSELMPLHLIASGLLVLAEQTQLRAPYPPSLQRGFDQICAASLQANIAPPRHVLELLDWCQTRPLAQWPLPLPSADYGDDLLLQAGRPTAQCQEWAVVARDVEDEVIENAVMRTALDLCRDADDNSLYVWFRRLLIEKPVLSTWDFQVQCREMPVLRPVLEMAYEIAPAAYSHGGQYTECARCKSLTVKTTDGELGCEDSQCRGEGALKLGRSWQGETLQLKRGLRRFVTRPGHAELKLYEKLRKRGYAVELWPDFDAYDLKIALSNEVWALDVKDWADPFLLATSINSKGAFRQSAAAPWTRAFWVFPDARRKRPRYLTAFKNRCQQLDARTSVTFERELLRRLA